MKHAFLATFLTATLVPALAAAETADSGRGDSDQAVAPARAIELTVGQGYNQGFGRGASRDASLSDLARGGPSLQLGLSYRLDPRWAFGVYVEGSRYFSGSEAPDGTATYAAATGVQASYHFLPFSRVNPWVSLGIGLRGEWIDRDDTGTEALYGFDALRLRFGADYRLGPSTRIGPMLGASLSTMVAHDAPDASDVSAIDAPGLSSFVFVGFQGRFELGGQRITEDKTRMASR